MQPDPSSATGVPLDFRSLVEHLPNAAVYVLDRNLRIAFAGGSVMADTRWPLATLAGRRLADVLPPPTYASAEPHLRATLAGERRTYQLAYPTGETFDVRTTPLAVANPPTPGVHHILVVAVDVTEQRRVVEALQRSEAALKRSQEIAHIGHWTWDTRTNTIAWSDEMKRIFGVDPDTFAGDLETVIDRAIHPDDAPLVRARNTAVLEEQRPSPLDYRVIWPDGTVRHVRATPGTTVQDDAGKIIQLFGVVLDVTDLKLHELEREQLLQRLQRQAEQLEQVLQTAPEGVLLLDQQHRLVMANARAHDLLAALAQYDPGERLLRLGAAPLAELLTSPPTGNWHALQVGPRSFELAARPLEAGSQPNGWVLVLREVTQERAIQEQLQRQERLAAVGQLAAGIAHDFNNIMSIISMYAELTSAAPGLSDRERARLQTIIDQTQRAAGLIRQILDFSRRSVLERQYLDLLPLLKEQVKLLQQTLPESVMVQLVHDDGPHAVRADPTRMQQLVMNLAVNARDAMPAGGVLTFTLERLSIATPKAAPLVGLEPGNWVRLEVRDTGTGIDPAHLPHLFEPFFTTKAPGQGTGLGLAQAHGIVAQHEGQITVASEPGHGTVFTIYLPQHAAVPLAPASSNDTGVFPRGQGECVLVVEDNDIVREALHAALESWGYAVVEATHGGDALVLLLSGAIRVDVVLSDVVMPQMGGLALVKAMRSAGLRQPVVLMSGHPADGEPADRDTLGIVGLLDKPPSSALLAALLAQALARV